MNFLVKHDPESKNHNRQDLLGNPFKDGQRRFIMLDQELVLTDKLSGYAKQIFQILRALNPWDTPNREYFRSRTGFGKSHIRQALKELSDAHMIHIRKVPYARAIREIYDLLPLESYTWLTQDSVRDQPDSGEQSVRNQPDSGEQSVRNQPDSEESRSEIRPTYPPVGPNMARLVQQTLAPQRFPSPF